ncbi:MAG: PEP-CTERM sorting domain-containing protein, partial [Puniceicoccales bacterium]|nr:PEP-CTERM sorting domain-containing protein [Puniceicoccales bacterium]
GTVTADFLNLAINANVWGGTLILNNATDIIQGTGMLLLSEGASLESSLLGGADTSYFNGKLEINGKDWSVAVAGVDYTLSGSTITVIPEPSTYALLGGVGLLGFLALRRRK